MEGVRVAGRGRGDHTALSPGPSVQRTLTFPLEMIPNVKVGSNEYMRQQSLNIQQNMKDADNLLLAKLPKKFALTMWQVLQAPNLTVNKSDISNITLIPTDSFYQLCVPLFPEIHEAKMETAVSRLWWMVSCYVAVNAMAFTEVNNVT